VQEGKFETNLEREIFYQNQIHVRVLVFDVDSLPKIPNQLLFKSLSPFGVICTLDSLNLVGGKELDVAFRSIRTFWTWKVGRVHKIGKIARIKFIL